jgi:3-deoxy-D-manno-octulosonic-acid transferase
MRLALPAYRALTTGVFFTALPGWWAYSQLTGRHRNGFRQRLGDYSGVPKRNGRPRIWFHAASVGEVNAAAVIAAALRQSIPRARLLVSTTTEHGQAAARERLGGLADNVLLAPLDWPGAVRRALDRVAPDLLVCVETEIWPNWLAAARRWGVRTAVVNGRISQRSMSRYRRVRPLMAAVLQEIDALSMIGTEDAARIQALGAVPGRITVNGNAKFDLAGAPPDPSVADVLSRRFNLEGGMPVIVAGSIRNGEAAPVLDAFQQLRRRFPEAVLIIAPRHLQRVTRICAETRQRSLACQRRSRIDEAQEPRTAPVVVLDTIGELRDLYSIANVVFCGGSLVPRGGQNLIEAAAWGKPVICGPHMDDFRAATDLLAAAGAVFPVADAQGLADRLEDLLGRPEKAIQAGLAGRTVVEENRGAAQRHAAVLVALLETSRKGKNRQAMD